MKHKFYECNCGETGCQFCDGGLGYCEICKGFEGTLPTECPGIPLDEHVQDAIYKGGLDFINGAWIVIAKDELDRKYEIIANKQDLKKQYPFHPDLTEEAESQAVDRMNKFIDQIKKEINGLINDFYCYELPYLESDSWTNFRNQLLDGFRDYKNNKIHAEFDFKEIRQQIYEEFRDEIIEDLNQDLIEENKRLIEFIKER